MTDDPLDAMKARWNHIQGYLFPWLREEVDPMTEALGRLVTTLDVIGLEAFVPEPPRGAGRPPDDRRALARAFVAKAVLGVPTTTALIERLDVDKSLRRILGWERRSQVPSEATFSRAFAEFAQGNLPDKMHAALIERSLGGRIVGVIARRVSDFAAAEGAQRERWLQCLLKSVDKSSGSSLRPTVREFAVDESRAGERIRERA